MYPLSNAILRVKPSFIYTSFPRPISKMSGWFHKPFGHRKKKGAEGDKRPAVTIKLRKNGGDVVNVTIKVSGTRNKTSADRHNL